MRRPPPSLKRTDTLVHYTTLFPSNIALNTRFISAATYELNTDSDEAYPRQHIPAKVYNDLSVQYDIGGKYQFGFGVNNILNIMPTHMPTIYRDEDRKSTRLNSSH